MASPESKSAEFAIAGSWIEAGPTPSGLYLVATPIGNLEDVTLRALRMLAGADRIVCEDTRITRRLLDRYRIETPLSPYHDHNAQRARGQILSWLDDGQAVALVSDAGTPLISDPGLKLVQAALAAGVRVTTAPGVSASLTALTLSGLASDQFLFTGFLPQKRTARRKRLGELAAMPATLVIYESPKRLHAALNDMAAILGDRQAAIARELTKRHEEVLRGTLAGLAAEIAGREQVRGEVVIVVAPPAAGQAPDDAEIEQRLIDALSTMSVRDAADVVSAETGQARRALYGRAVRLAGRRDKPG